MRLGHGEAPPTGGGQQAHPGRREPHLGADVLPGVASGAPPGAEAPQRRGLARQYDCSALDPILASTPHEVKVRSLTAGRSSGSADGSTTRVRRRDGQSITVPPSPGVIVIIRRRVPCLAPAGATVKRSRRGAQHEPHLQQREARAEAAPPPAAERQPGVGAGLSAEEALGPERVRIGIDLGIVVNEVGAADQHDARRDRSSRRSSPPA